MFEQSMLLDTGTGKRSGAVAASLAIQSIAVGVLVMIPLIWGDKLGIARPWLPITMPILRPLEQPEPVKAAHAPATPSNLTIPRVFHAIETPRTIPTAPVVIGDDAMPAAAIGANSTAAGVGEPGASFSDLLKFAPPAPKPAVEPAPAREAPHPVGGDVQAARLIRRVIPMYPVLAKQARISGTVRLIGIIAKDGTIEQLQVVSGHPLLVKSAVEAVRQWVYQPTLLNGSPVEVIAPIDVIFTLAQ